MLATGGIPLSRKTGHLDPQQKATRMIDEAILARIQDDIWTFWFGDQDVHDVNYLYRLGFWFGGTWAVDVYIRQRFGRVHQLFLDALLREQDQQIKTDPRPERQPSTDELIAIWNRVAQGAHPTTPARGHMTLVILLDQLSRNIHRGSPHMFTTDGLALSVALQVIDTPRLWNSVSRPERLFLNVPLVHVEDVKMAHRHMVIVQQMLDELPAEHPELRQTIEAAWREGQRHLDILQRFGRYPYRNTLLGRQTTPAEEEFLRDNSHLGFIKSVASNPVPPAAQLRIDSYIREHEGEPKPFIPLEILQAWHQELSE